MHNRNVIERKWAEKIFELIIMENIEKLINLFIHSDMKQFQFVYPEQDK